MKENKWLGDKDSNLDGGVEDSTPEHKDVQLGRQKEVDDLKRMDYTLTYIAPENEKDWSNWYVLSGVKHGTEFYFRRWYSDDSVVSLEFIYPKNLPRYLRS